MAFFILLMWGLYTRSAAVFALVGVFSILTGAMLAAGEPVEFFTGGFTMTENADQNVWTAVPDMNALTISNSSPINMWHYVFLYGGFVWIIVALLLAMRGEAGVELEE